MWLHIYLMVYLVIMCVTFVLRFIKNVIDSRAKRIDFALYFRAIFAFCEFGGGTHHM